MKYPNTSKSINKALNDKSMSAQKLSNITGIAKSSISGYVNGVHKIGADKAAKIGKVLNVFKIKNNIFDMGIIAWNNTNI